MSASQGGSPRLTVGRVDLASRARAAAASPYGLAVASALVASIYTTTLLQLTTPQGLVFGAVSQLAFVAPGVLVVRAATGSVVGWLVPLTLGPLLGMGLSSMALLGLWAAGIRGPWVLAVAPAVAGVLAWPARRLHGRQVVAAPSGTDALWILILLVVVPVVVARPFSLVGAVLDDGQVYRAYFTADYVWRRAVVAELAKGDFLPVNPFYVGDALHYYWLPHLLSAVEYRAVGQALGLDHLLLMRSVFVDALFVVFLYGVARMFVRTPWCAAAGTACVFLATSFEGTYALWDHWRAHAPLSLLRNINIDAVSRWFFGGMPIDGLHRMLLYQPHHAVGYSVGLLGVLMIARRARPVDPATFAVAGGLLGLSTLISSFGGLMLTSVAALHEGVSVLRARDWSRAAAHFASAGLPLALAAALVTLLQYVDVGGRVIQLGLNRVATHQFFPATALSFGPMLLLGGAGAMVAWGARRRDLQAFAALAVVCVLFYFFVDIRDHQNVYVGWRVGHLMFIGLGVLAGVLFECLANARFRVRLLGWPAVAAIVMAALPTVAIDLYNTQDVRNREQGPGFKWTLVLSHDEIDAFAWIKRATPRDAVFQVDPIARDSNTWAYIPSFAERRMGVGLPISMVPLDKYRSGAKQVQWLFDVQEPAAARAYAARHHIDFLLIGPPEREAHPGVETRFDREPILLPLVYRNPTISIYQVTPTGP